jgi:hypothetical protein
MDIGLECVWGKNNVDNSELCVKKNSLNCSDYVTISGCTWSESIDGELIVCEWDGDDINEPCGDSVKCESLKDESLGCENFKSLRG